MKKRQTNDARTGWRRDRVVWLSIAVILLLGILFNDCLRHISLSLCLLTWGAILIVSGWLFGCTRLGGEFKTFVALAWQELNQVVWPSRDEVVHTTTMVAVIVFVVSFILWLIDLILVRILGFFIGS